VCIGIVSQTSIQTGNVCDGKVSQINLCAFHFRPGQEAQKIFKANQPMDGTQVKTKLIGFGFSLLEGIDPNPENYVCAGIIHTKSIQIGCLLRLEPNSSAQVSLIDVPHILKSIRNIVSAAYKDHLRST
jgi:hypothetical protein